MVIAGLMCSSGSCHAQDWDGVLAPIVRGVALFRTGSELSMLELRLRNRRDQVLIRRLSGERLLQDDESESEVWSKPGFGPASVGQRMGFLMRQDGSWALVSNFHKGGGRGLDYWWCTKNPHDAGAAGTVAHLRAMDVAVVESHLQWIALDQVPKGHKGPILRDIWDLQLIESSGVVRVIGCGDGRAIFAGDDYDDGDVIWSAKLPSGTEAGPPAAAAGQYPVLLVGARITVGSSPRVVRWRDASLLAVRTGDEGRIDSALRFYRSKDLAKWEIDAYISNTVVAQKCYAIAIDGDQVWLATTVTEGTTRRVRLLYFAQREGRWVQVALLEAPQNESASRRDPHLWLLPTEKPEGPSVVFRGEDGAMTLLRR